MCDQTKRSRGAFTLVELMVVIVIIIILMGLLTPVLINVMARAREARITAEISALDGALKAYKERYGAYPPSDFITSAGQASVVAHLSHIFPRCNATLEAQAIPTWNSNTNTAIGMSPAQALVFWLSGFTSDPEHPISAHYPNTGYTPSSALALTPLFQFDQSRLTVSGVAAALGSGSVTGKIPVPQYGPADGQGTPYLYFAAQNYTTQPGWTGTQGDSCLPYLLDNGPNLNTSNPYVNPSSFQIISAGLDGNFGTSATFTQLGTANYTFNSVCSYPSGTATTAYSGYTDNLPDQAGVRKVTAYSQGDLDNLTNFSSSNLKDAQPH